MAAAGGADGGAPGVARQVLTGKGEKIRMGITMDRFRARVAQELARNSGSAYLGDRKSVV